MIEFKIIVDSDDWTKVLAEFKQWDFFHAFEFHTRSIDSSSSKPWMAVLLESGKPVFAMPMIRREMADGMFDLVSVYGYAGPLYSSADDLSEHLERVKKELRAIGCVSLFCRLHPIIHADVETGSEIADAGKTVAISCHDERLDDYRKTTRYEIRKIIRSGATVTFDSKPESVDTFADIYAETMRALEADEFYFFEKTFFDSLFQIEGVTTAIGSVWLDDEVISSGLFTSVNGIAQYFLGGAKQAFQKLAPQKFLLHEAAGWAAQQGANTLHLGGGRGAKEDGLFRFKAGFSKQTLDFKLMRIILDQQLYGELTQSHALESGCELDELKSQGYFPAYRTPIKNNGSPASDPEID